MQLSMPSWSFVYMYQCSAQYSFQATGCFLFNPGWCIFMPITSQTYSTLNPKALPRCLSGDRVGLMT